jgi:uncharacterized protein (TIGR02246 family)
MSPEQSTTELATTPEETINLFTARLNSGDVDAMLELYDPEASFAAQPGTVVSGTEGIREALNGFAAMQPTLHSNVTWVQRAGSVALVVNEWAMEGRQPDGETMQMTGRAADVVRRGPDGGWRFYIDCPWASS